MSSLYNVCRTFYLVTGHLSFFIVYFDFPWLELFYQLFLATDDDAVQIICFPLLDPKMLLVVRLHTIEINNKIVHDINLEISWSIPAIAAESVIATHPRYISLFVIPYWFCVSHYKLTFFIWFRSEHWTVSFCRHHCFNFRKQPFSLCKFFILLLYLLNWLHKTLDHDVSHLQYEHSLILYSS